MSEQGGSGGKVPVVEAQGNCAIVKVEAKLLDESDLKALAHAVDQASAMPDVQVIIIDLSQVKLIPSLGLGGLVQMASKCRARKQKLKLASPSVAVRQVFTITRLDKVLEIVHSVEAGVE